MHAVIEADGRQHLVRPGDRIEMSGTSAAVGDELTFDRVLAVGDKVGTPLVEGASVRAKVIKTGRGPKIYVTKFKRRKNYRRRVGHRSNIFEVEIIEIGES
jgi:large subunit ribosomal protein L21